MTAGTFAPDYPLAAVGGELSMPKPPGVFRRYWARHPWFADSLVTAAYFVPSFIATLVSGFDPKAPAPAIVVAQLVAVAIAATAIMFRRHRPWLTMVVAWVVALLVHPLGNTDTLPILFGLYAVAVYRSTRAVWVAFGGSSVVVVVSSFMAVWISGSHSVAPFGADAPAASSQFIILMLVATLIGITVGNRKRYLHALIDRAHDLAQQRDQQAELATAHERSRIAREMHDIVSHSLTVMITLAEGSAAAAPREPQKSAETMRLVAETGRTALGDMRRMLGVLTDSQTGGGRLLPQPGWEELPDLIEQFRVAGLPITLQTRGSAVADPAAQLTVYRIVQEGLTNVLRHAPGADNVHVDVHHDGTVVEITVRDDAPPSGIPATTQGHGLVGMRERLALFGGTLDAGPLNAGPLNDRQLEPNGWQLVARFEVPR